MKRMGLAPPLFQGIQKAAEYRAMQPGERGAGNPCLEALPAAFSREELAGLLASYPVFSDDVRALPMEVRAECLCLDLMDFLQPLDEHLDLGCQLGRLLRLGYHSRNPVDLAYQRQLVAGAGEMVEAREQLKRHRRSSLANGMKVTGISGIGKSTCIEAVLSLYPQVIWHGHYGEHALTRAQVVWLKVDCPLDGSPKALCRDFFAAIDPILGTSYADAYRGTGLAAHDLLRAMANVAVQHWLGLLVIDELQNLTAARGRGDDSLLNFLLRLENSIGVPVIRVGTYKAESLFLDSFQLGRRGLGPGSFVWDRMRKTGEAWRVFWAALWHYQYIRTPAVWDEDFDKVFYHETQGITDLAVKLFAVAQIRAMEVGTERLTPEFVSRVAAHDFRTVQPALSALRLGKSDGLARYEDLLPAGDDLGRLVSERRKAGMIPLDVRVPRTEPESPGRSRPEKPAADALDRPGGDVPGRVVRPARKRAASPSPKAAADGAGSAGAGRPYDEVTPGGLPPMLRDLGSP
jgi:hypothetical protein